MSNLHTLATTAASSPRLAAPLRGAVPLATTAPVPTFSKTKDNINRSQLAAELLKNPAAMQLFCDRVYMLLLQDLRKQQERSCHSSNYPG